MNVAGQTGGKHTGLAMAEWVDTFCPRRGGRRNFSGDLVVRGETCMQHLAHLANLAVGRCFVVLEMHGPGRRGRASRAKKTSKKGKEHWRAPGERGAESPRSKKVQGTLRRF